MYDRGIACDDSGPRILADFGEADSSAVDRFMLLHTLKLSPRFGCRLLAFSGDFFSFIEVGWLVMVHLKISVWRIHPPLIESCSYTRWRPFYSDVSVLAFSFLLGFPEMRRDDDSYRFFGSGGICHRELSNQKRLLFPLSIALFTLFIPRTFSFVSWIHLSR